jgi:hypothetical protein
MGNACRNFMQNLLERNHLEDEGENGRIISKCILINYIVGCGLNSNGSGLGPKMDFSVSSVCLLPERAVCYDKDLDKIGCRGAL